ncbi:hypothetical protein Mbo2_077 [Rhodococcus phage Mbo2]|uniref:Uncharacterized protein n=1 Tax=Rhodococcus phage Mbo2 TaxID=2936911 RepID=A0A9E7ILR0_9CAUD|nr:hypothetical protein Mbo2_077 [Rhodococcus phage Mbo2]
MPQEPIYRFIQARLEDLQEDVVQEALAEITRLHEPTRDETQGIWVCKACSYHHEEIGKEVQVYAPCEHLRIIASIWSDQPGFYESWARQT